MPDQPPPSSSSEHSYRPSSEPDPGPFFSEFAARAAMAAPPSDLAGVRARARRHRAIVCAVAAAAIAALVTPIGVYVLTGHDTGAGRVSLAPATSTLATDGAPALAGFPSAGTATARGGAGSQAGGSAAGVTRVPSTAPGGATTSSAPATGASAGPVARTPPPGDLPDWANVTLEIPANDTGCAAGTARFEHSQAVVGATPYRMGAGNPAVPEVAYGDVDADGRPDAVVVISCVWADRDRANPPSLVLLVGTGPPVHTVARVFSTSPRVLDGEGGSVVSQPAIEGATISFKVRNFEGTGECVYRTRWLGNGFDAGSCTE